METLKQFIKLLYTRLTISTPPPNPTWWLHQSHSPSHTSERPRQGKPCSAAAPRPGARSACRSALPWLFKSFTPALPQIKHKREKEISPSKKHFPEARGITRFLQMRVFCSSCTLNGTWRGGGPVGGNRVSRAEKALTGGLCTALSSAIQISSLALLLLPKTIL